MPSMAGAWACATGPSVYPRVLRNLDKCYSGFCSAATRHFTGGMNEGKESIEKKIFSFLMKRFLVVEVVSNGKKAFFPVFY